jgi:hypothetical protein
MSLPVYVGIGAAAGAAIGGAAGFVIRRQLKGVGKKVPAVSAAAPNTAPPVTGTAPAALPAATGTKTESKKGSKTGVELFGVKVTYLTSSSEFYTMLVRFETYLQFATERDSFKAVVENIDNLIGLEALLHGRNPISKAALPNLAENARRKILQILTDIIEFSYEERPSPTKKEAMSGIRDEINNNMLEIVKDMNRALAAMPVIVK